MLLSCGSVTALVVFCYWRILTLPATKDEMHAPLDIDTRDTDS